MGCHPIAAVDLFDRRLAVERVFDPDLVDLVVRDEDELGLGLRQGSDALGEIDDPDPLRSSRR